MHFFQSHKLIDITFTEWLKPATSLIKSGMKKKNYDSMKVFMRLARKNHVRCFELFGQIVKYPSISSWVWPTSRIQHYLLETFWAVNMDRNAIMYWFLLSLAELYGCRYNFLGRGWTTSRPLIIGGIEERHLEEVVVCIGRPPNQSIQFVAQYLMTIN